MDSGNTPEMNRSGKIISASGTMASASGLAGAALFDLVEIGVGIFAWITALYRDHVELALFTQSKVAPGTAVTLRSEIRLAADAPLLGQVVSGSDILESPSETRTTVPLGSRAASPRWTKTRSRQRFTTGLLVYDLAGRLCRGDAILLSGHGIGSLISLGVIAHVLGHQEDSGARCIYLSLRHSATTMSARDLLDRIAISRRTHTSRTAFLEPGQNAAPAMNDFLCRAAIALAHSWAEQGEDVVLFIDGYRALPDDNAGCLPSSAHMLELITSAAYTRDRGVVTVVVRPAIALPAPTRQLFDHVIDLRRALSGSIDHAGSKLVDPPLAVEPLRALGAIVNASAVADTALLTQPSQLEG